MRVALLAGLVFLLAGCTQGDPGSRNGHSGFQSTCPSWVKYPHNGQIIEGALQWTNLSTNPDDLERWDFMAPNATRPGQGIGDGNLLEYDGHPLDEVVFDFHLRDKSPGTPRRALYVQDAQLHMMFFASEGGYPGQELEAYDTSKGPSSAKVEWIFGSDAAEGYTIHNVTLRVDLAQPDQPPAPAGVFVHWWIDPDLDGDKDTPSVALMHYAPEFWYRTCSADGTKT